MYHQVTILLPTMIPTLIILIQTHFAALEIIQDHMNNP
jgi:hypothetical protein